MPRMSEAEKFANVLGKSLNGLDLNYHMVVAHTITLGTAIQKNLFELMLAFLNKYASLYASGEVTETMKMFSMCKMSYDMMCALDAPQYWDNGATGKHCAD